MKNNKGYTLVELLVAMFILAIIMAEVFNMMINSATLYRNGTYEIDLQTEAQQIVQQMEELLIDANVSVNVVPNGLSVNDIQIVNHDITYDIQYERPDPTVSYGNIYLTATGSYTANHELMGEYVESISLNMAEFASASKITLEVLLRNDKYTYATSKDIYLRNDIGLSGNRATPSTSGDFDEELDVLRFREYNLSAMYNSGENHEDKNYTYQFQDGTTYNADYVITNSGTTYYLKAQSALNNNHGTTAGEYLIDAIDPDTGSKAFTIKISTDEVKIGAAGFGLFYQYADLDAKITSPVHVEGIYLGGADSVTWTLVAVDGGTRHELVTQNSLTYSSENGGDHSYRFNGDLYIRLNYLKAEIRDDWNSILFEGRKIQDCGNYYNAILNYGGMIQMVTEFDFPSGPNLVVNSYMYPSSANESDAMPPDVADVFWSNCH